MPAASTQLQDFILSDSPARPETQISWWTRLSDAFAAARMRQADREIARLIELQGGRITDSLERQIERDFL